jgi:formate dehydrogenase assembly factor FdhD
MRQVKMTRLDLEHCKSEQTLDYVAEEVPMQVTVNDVYSFVIWSSPSQFKELAVGHLYAEDILHDVDEIQTIAEDAAKNLCQITLKPTVDLDERLKTSAEAPELSRS